MQINGKNHGLDVQLQQVPPYSHQSNGSVEKCNDLVQKQVRTMRLDVEERVGGEAHPGLAVWPWLVRHAAWCLARYAVKASGRDAYDAEYRGEIAPFAEVVMARRNVSDSGAIQGEGRLVKADTPWEKAVWLGRSEGTGEHIVGDESGIYMPRTVRRIPSGLEASKAMVLKLRRPVGPHWRCRRQDQSTEADGHDASCT